MVEFLSPELEAVLLADLAPAFLESNGVPLAHWDRPFRIEVSAKLSKAGNVYFEYQQAVVPLPHGLDTKLRVEGAVLEADEIRPSQSGHPTRRHQGTTNISGVVYAISAFVTEGKRPFWVKVHAQKGRSSALADPAAPQGGRFA
jgi:hypothetical protein